MQYVNNETNKGEHTDNEKQWRKKYADNKREKSSELTNSNRMVCKELVVIGEMS